MQHLESFLRPRDLTVEILHDNIVRFDALLDMVRGTFRPSDGSDFTVVGDRVLFHSMPSVTSLELADSKDEPLIQAADLLCGFVRTLFAKLKAGSSITDADRDTAFDLAMIQVEFETWDSNVPDSLLAGFAHHAFAGRTSTK